MRRRILLTNKSGGVYKWSELGSKTLTLSPGTYLLEAFGAGGDNAMPPQTDALGNTCSAGYGGCSRIKIRVTEQITVTLGKNSIDLHYGYNRLMAYSGDITKGPVKDWIRDPIVTTDEIQINETYAQGDTIDVKYEAGKRTNFYHSTLLGVDSSLFFYWVHLEPESLGTETAPYKSGSDWKIWFEMRPIFEYRSNNTIDAPQYVGQQCIIMTRNMRYTTTNGRDRCHDELTVFEKVQMHIRRGTVRLSPSNANAYEGTLTSSNQCTILTQEKQNGATAQSMQADSVVTVIKGKVTIN